MARMPVEPLNHRKAGLEINSDVLGVAVVEQISDRVLVLAVVDGWGKLRRRRDRDVRRDRIKTSKHSRLQSSVQRTAYGHVEILYKCDSSALTERGAGGRQSTCQQKRRCKTAP